MLLRFVPRVLPGLLICLALLLTGCSTTRITEAVPTAVPAATTPAWADHMATVGEARLPAEARRTLGLIDRGGPFPYAKDGSAFRNFERRLPRHPRGYYHEYTVETPGSPGRGARRIVTGQGGEFYYTDDHYETFLAVLR
ncbi:ribonuclease domain-containing protein [Streptomyces sp. NPDC026672]|uniref:ribonuclease domain-containing protein n=1 Tax=unclassified Streptomyces TaxID=2593676 RepID=UPI0033CB9EC4